MVEISEGRAQGRLLVESYGEGRFGVSGHYHQGSILILGDRVLPWPIAEAGEISVEVLAPVLAQPTAFEVLLIGSGPAMTLLPPQLRQALRDKGIGVDAMATPAACRTYNVLMMEGRLAAAALIAVE